ncbi:PAS domain S-box protein [Methanolobus bombayensis]|uniref:PAS domain S-box protein n=1 Tax=Methanolobus bombayensis TaxID=38023 RepID=UPI001AEB8367|nr:PAS domain S-box protein [Methanolobus bombayensis]MBP1907941.1 PAS domain S-box-containing protein [Methanolobus bombayensis]
MHSTKPDNSTIEHIDEENALFFSKYSIDHSIDSISWITSDASFIYVNEATCDELGYSREELLSMKVFDIDPYFSENMWKGQWDLMKKAQIGTVETIHISKEGNVIPVEITYSYLQYKDFEYVFSFSRDITRRKVVEKNLRLMQHSIDHSMEPAFWIAPDASFMFVNEAVCNNYGYSREELLSMKVFDISQDFPENKWNDLWNKVKQQGSLQMESKHYTKDGRIFPVEISLSYLEFEDVQYIFSFVRDITERKNSEEALKKYTDELKHSNEMQQALGNIVNSSPMIVFLWKVEHNWPVEFVSENIRQFGYSAEDFTSGKLLYGEIIHPDDLVTVQARSTEFIESDQTCFDQEYRILTKSGEVRLVNERTFIQRDEGKIEFIEGIIVDITSSIQSNGFMRLQCELGNVLAFNENIQETYEQLLELTLQMDPFDCGCLYIVDTSTGSLNIVAHKGLSSEYIENTSYYNSNSLLTKLVMMGKIVYKDHSEICAMTATESPDEMLNFTALIPLKYGDDVIAMIKLMSHSQNEISNDSRNSLENVASQIGGFINRMISEIELQNNVNDLQGIFEALDDILIIVDLEGCILNYNSAVSRRLGYSAEELIGVNIISMIPHKRYLEAARVFFNIIDEEISYFNFPLIAKDQSLVPVVLRFSGGKWKGQNVMIGISHDLINEI